MGTLTDKSITIYVNFKIVNRLGELNDTIEDVYSYNAYRFMALGCYDGPSLPFYSSESDVSL